MTQCKAAAITLEQHMKKKRKINSSPTSQQFRFLPWRGYFCYFFCLTWVPRVPPQVSKHTSSTGSKGKRVAVLQRTHFQWTHPAENIQNQLEGLVSVWITSQGVTCGFFTVYNSSDTSKAPRNSSHISAMPLTILICMEFLWSGHVWQGEEVSIHFIYSTKILLIFFPPESSLFRFSFLMLGSWDCSAMPTSME